MSLVIVGSLAFDTIETPFVRKERIIGGSCSYAALAASYFTSPKIVAIIGEDFPSEMIDLLNRRGVDTRGVEVESGKTFHWSGRYEEDPNQRTTLKLDLNVFENFKPQLIPDYQKADVLFLGNIDPDLQEDILKQVESPKLVAMDTINHWIESKSGPLFRVLEKVDIFFGNDEETRMMAGEINLIKAGKRLVEKGPSLVVIKKGEHGALLIGKDFLFCVPAFPSEKVIDPTGAGDSFAGGFLGYLDKKKDFSSAECKRAAVFGSAMASFTIGDFGIERLKALSMDEIEGRFSFFKKLVSF
jgi:sugar/nucleoside kinase (ribokinase family)